MSAWEIVVLMVTVSPLPSSLVVHQNGEIIMTVVVSTFLVPPLWLNTAATLQAHLCKHEPGQATADPRKVCTSGRHVQPPRLPPTRPTTPRQERRHHTTALGTASTAHQRQPRQRPSASASASGVSRTFRVVQDASHGVHDEGEDRVEHKEGRDSQVEQRPAPDVVGQPVVPDHEQRRRRQNRIHLSRGAGGWGWGGGGGSSVHPLCRELTLLFAAQLLVAEKRPKNARLF